MSYLSLVYGGGVVLSSAAAVGAAYLGNMLNPVVSSTNDSAIINAFGGGEKAKLVLEILKQDSSQNFDNIVKDVKEGNYPGEKLLKRMEEVGLGIKDLAKCSDIQKPICGLVVKKVADILNHTANPPKFIGMGDQTGEATEMLQNTQSK